MKKETKTNNKFMEMFSDPNSKFFGDPNCFVLAKDNERTEKLREKIANHTASKNNDLSV